MKITIAQMNVVTGKPKENVNRMLEYIKKAKERRIDLICFSEMCIGGYMLGDMFTSDDYCRYLMQFNEEIREASDGIAVAFGNIFLHEKNHWHGPNKDGRSRKYNAVYIYQDKKPAKRGPTGYYNLGLPDGIQPKTLLPNYRFFDDMRYFFGAIDMGLENDHQHLFYNTPFYIKVGDEEVKVGFECCEDLWCQDYRIDHKAINPTAELIKQGAEIIVNLSSSPWTFGKNHARDNAVKFVYEDCDKRTGGRKFIFIYANKVGVENNGKNIITYDGGSTVYGEDGKPRVIAKCPYEQEFIYFDTEAVKKMPPVERPAENRIAQKDAAIIQGLKHIKDWLPDGTPIKFVHGLSGGIDSALVLCYLVRAFGAENITAINMPTKYNSKQTKNAAEKLAKKLGVNYYVVPIEDLYMETLATVEKAKLNILGKVEPINSLTLENIQAKIRGTAILSNLAGALGAFFTCNGNKDEIWLGYATLYGDVGGVVAPIGDLTKDEVYEAARYQNEVVYGKEIIPNETILNRLFENDDMHIFPSAELKEDQKDPIKFGYHCALIRAFMNYQKCSANDIIRWWLKGTLHTNLDIPVELLNRYNLNDPKVFYDDLIWFIKKGRGAVFKRVQSPPIIVLSKTAFGYDLREVILPPFDIDELCSGLCRAINIHSEKGMVYTKAA